MMMLVLLVSCLLASSVDAAITGWSSPPITGATGSATHTTPIPEDTQTGSAGVTITATSDVTGATIAYALINQPTPALFEIASDTGVVSITDALTLDYETIKSYTIEVTAVEAGATGAVTATATITLNVGNVGPVFAESSKTVCIQQGSPEGTTITTIEASKEDGVTETLTFNTILDEGTASTLFEIDGSTGDVKAIAALDDATTYILTVEASVGTEKDTMVLTVNVGDCSSASMVSPINMFVLLMALIVSINKYVN